MGGFEGWVGQAMLSSLRRLAIERNDTILLDVIKNKRTGRFMLYLLGISAASVLTHRDEARR